MVHRETEIRKFKNGCLVYFIELAFLIGFLTFFFCTFMDLACGSLPKAVKKKKWASKIISPICTC